MMDRRRVMIAAGAVALVIIAIFAAAVQYDAKYAKYEVISTYSPNGEYILEISQIGKPEKASGMTNCRFQIIRGPRDVNTYNTQVNHGGKALGTENFEVKWARNGVVIDFHGDGQEDVTYRVNYDGTTKMDP